MLLKDYLHIKDHCLGFNLFFIPLDSPETLFSPPIPHLSSTQPEFSTVQENFRLIQAYRKYSSCCPSEVAHVIYNSRWETLEVNEAFTVKEYVLRRDRGGKLEHMCAVTLHMEAAS